MPGRFALALILIGIGTLTESAGLLVLVPLLQVIGLDVQEGGVGVVAHWMRTVFGHFGLPLNLISVLSLYVGLIVVQAGLRRWQTVTTGALQFGFTAHLRKRVHRAVTRASWLQITRLRSSDLAYAMTGQVERIGNGTHSVLRLALDGAVTAVYLATTLYVSPLVTVLVVSAGLCLLLLLRRSTHATALLGQAMTRMGAEAYRGVLEHLQGIKLAKSYGAEGRSIGLFSELSDTVAATNLRGSTVQAGARCRFDIGAAVLLGVVIYVAIAILATPTADVLILLFAFARVMPRFSALQQGFEQILNVLPDFTAVMVLEEQLARHPDTHLTRRLPVQFRRAVRLESVSFAYEGRPGRSAAEPALADVSLTIPAGRTTAIVGPSGSGKSTLADLVLGLIIPQRGRVLIDETPLSPELIHGWRARIGYVPQDTFLFHDTVRANLQWACPEASEAELREAIEAAAAEFVDRLPRQLDTVVGDRGVRLSGGERQRLALARALLPGPSMLILDEATSSLDSENERRVQDAIERLHGRLTILVITHRLTTVRLADTIHVLDGGRLVESGDWEDLLNGTTGRFRSLCAAQGLVV
jgi:ATP-binding cassette subfamily C protein